MGFPTSPLDRMPKLNGYPPNPVKTLFLPAEKRYSPVALVVRSYIAVLYGCGYTFASHLLTRVEQQEIQQ